MEEVGRAGDEHGRPAPVTSVAAILEWSIHSRGDRHAVRPQTTSRAPLLEYQGRGVRVVKVNVDEAPKIAADFGVRSIPTLVFFRDGEPLFEMVGIVSKPVLEREIGEILTSA